MNLNQYIAELEKLRQEVGGEIRVVRSAGATAPIYAIGDVHLPKVETLQVKTARESYEKVYRAQSWGKNLPVDSGVKVVML